MWLGSVVFFFAGPGLEAGVGPYLLTGGWDSHDPPAALVVAGAVLVAVGLAAVIACFVQLAREGRGTPTPAAPTTRLVTGGPYAVVRHPMYLATAITILGEALLLGSWVLALAAAVYLLTMATIAVRIEDRQMTRRFGADYSAYSARVPGWLPGRFQ